MPGLNEWELFYQRAITDGSLFSAKNQNALNELLDFSKSIFASENLEFLQALHEFEQKSPQQQREDFQMLMKTYITDDKSLKQINIPGKALNELNTKAEELAADQKLNEAFASAKKQICTNCLKDIVPKFINDPATPIKLDNLSGNSAQAQKPRANEPPPKKGKALLSSFKNFRDKLSCKSASSVDVIEPERRPKPKR